MSDEQVAKALDTSIGSAVQSFVNGSCPHCGYCPHCGRGGYGTSHYYPNYPISPIWVNPYVVTTIASATGTNTIR